MIRMRKTKELSEILARLRLRSFTFMQTANVLLLRTVWGVTLQDVSSDFIKCIILLPFKNCRNVRKKGREQYKGLERWLKLPPTK